MASPTTTLLPLLLLLSSLQALSTPDSAAAAAFESSLIDQACLNTLNSSACTARLRLECSRGPRGPLSTLHAAARATIGEAIRSIEAISALSPLSTTHREQAAIHDCTELLARSADELSWSLAEMPLLASTGDGRRESNLRSWLSAALTNPDTCVQGFEGTDGRLLRRAARSVSEVSQLVANLLAMYRRMRSIIPHSGRFTHINASTELPPWITAEDEELLRADARGVRANAVVAQDGSGEYRTVAEAVAAAPDHGSRRYVIFVKRGVYKENVELKKKKSNIMVIGEGMGVTVISASRSFMDGWTTFRTATFAVSGQGFIARDITFRNAAGPERHQAVALRVDSDRSAFFRCSMEGYQDTLYAHSLRHFYRECHIYGTIDFIFGNAQAVFQNCNIFTRKPLPYQKVTITAQGRKDPNQNTGFSIHNSFVHASYPAYLGRPWKPFSRTVFMQSYLSAQVQPAGWLEWAGNFALNTLFYGEYSNYGPGAGLKGRVHWPGYHVIKDAGVARFFTVRRFIDGVSWLPATRVPYTADLVK